MAGLVDAGEAEVSGLAHLAVLDAVDNHGDVAGGAEGVLVGIVGLERDRLATVPVADVVCVAVDERDGDAGFEDVLEFAEEGGVDEVAGLLEGPVDVIIGGCI